MSAPACSPPAVWLTRPLHRAQNLAAELTQRGYQPLLRPAIVIRDLPPQPPTTPNLPHLPHLAVFVSAEAATRHPASPSPVPTLAVGQSTADALPAGHPLAAPPARDSQTLLALPILQNIAGKTILVFGGISAQTPSPSPALCAELNRRGAKVLPIPKYRRDPAPPDDGEIARLAAAKTLRAAVAFSAETLHAMLTVADPRDEWLRNLPLFVHHPAVAESAARMNFLEITTAENLPAAIAKKIPIP